ncbi:3-oxoacyl-ACP reductase [Burkholderia pseudomallei]|nr:3-oxoacyl-ACP reductase [Burkholderia pseudomallei]
MAARAGHRRRPAHLVPIGCVDTGGSTLLLLLLLLLLILLILLASIAPIAAGARRAASPDA